MLSAPKRATRPPLKQCHNCGIFEDGHDGANVRRFPSKKPQCLRKAIFTATMSALLLVSRMIRKAFVMSVNEGQEREYERRHQPIWPELEAALLAHGVTNYSIFLHPGTRQLFAYAEIASEARWAAIALTRVPHFAPCAKKLFSDGVRPRGGGFSGGVRFLAL